MIDLEQIESFYPEYLRAFKKNLLREYLQYKILEIIFDSKFGKNLAFMGGTALRIIYSIDRFSEDLDFDNLGLGKMDFENLVELIRKNLERMGYVVEIKNVFKGAYRSYIKFVDILYDSKISPHKNEKLLIQVDTEPQMFRYNPSRKIINKFDVFLRLNAVPQEILLSQKIACIFSRKRPMGRDFYDVVFLMGRTKPNFEYLKLKLNINSGEDLKNMLVTECKKFDFKSLAKDMEPILINPSGEKKVFHFLDYIENTNFTFHSD